MSPDFDAELDLIVECCEAQWRDTGDADLKSLLPPQSHPGYAEIAVELFRIDLEHRITRGQAVSMEWYVSRFPTALAQKQQLAALAFEEFRLRLEAGETVTPENYQVKYGIPTDSWTDGTAKPAISPGVDAPQEHVPSPDVGEELDGSTFRMQERADTDRPGDHGSQRDPNLRPNTRFRDFSLVRELGAGAFSQVFLARQKGIANREVVLKFTSMQTVEIDRLGRLQHSNIVPILSVHEYRQGSVVCMPYLGDATLTDLIRQTHGATATDAPDTNGGVDRCLAGGLEAATLTLAIRLTFGLQHAHSRDILHGDIKPANILLAFDGTPLLLDFNLAGDLTTLRPEVVGGTLRYMPPEHKEAFESGRFELGPDVRSDIYSLGLVLTEVLLGTTRPNDAAFAGVSPALAAILRKCTRLELEQRYQNCDELLEDLQRHNASLPLKHQREPSNTERVRKWTRRHPRLTSGVSLFSIFAAITGVLCVLLVMRSSQLGREKALREFGDFAERVPIVCSLLSVRHNANDCLADGLAEASVLLDALKVGDSYEVSALLPPKEQRRQKMAVGQLLYHRAHAQWMLSHGQASVSDRDETRAVALASHATARDWFEHEVGEIPVALTALERRITGKAVGRMLDKEPEVTSPIERLLYATELIESRQYRKVVNYLDRVKVQFSDDANFWTLMASGYSGLAEFGQAEACLTAALAIHVESWIVRTDRGLARLALKQYDAAADDFREVIKLRPNYYGGYLNLAKALGGQKKYTEAIAALDKAIEFDGPTRLYFLRSSFYVELMRAAIRKKDVTAYQQARACRERDRKLGLAAEPTDAASWSSRGLQRVHNDPEGALDDFRKATELDRLDVDAWRNIAYVYDFHFKKPNESVKALNVLIDAGMDDAGAYVGRAVLHARAGRVDEAIADEEKAANFRGEPITIYQRACVYALLADRKGEYRDRALTLLIEALEENPLSVMRSYVLGTTTSPPDPDLDRMKEVEGFREFVETVRAKTKLAALEEAAMNRLEQRQQERK